MRWGHGVSIDRYFPKKTRARFTNSSLERHIFPPFCLSLLSSPLLFLSYYSLFSLPFSNSHTHAQPFNSSHSLPWQRPMHVTTRHPHQLLILAWLWVITFYLSAPVIAQPPLVTCCMAYNTIDESAFYIQGGSVDPGVTASSASIQFYSLDLTLPSWDTSNPPWKALPPPTGPITLAPTFRHSMSVSPDRRTLTIFVPNGPGLISNFNIGEGSWTPVTTPSPSQLMPVIYGAQAATDPTTGIVYIPPAYSGAYLSIYAPSTGVVTTAPMPPVVAGGLSRHSFVWSQVRKTFILFGGVLTTNYFSEYDPTTGKWTELYASGPTPPLRQASCMVPAYNGTKMILFGGHNSSGPSGGYLFILDVPTLTWNQGPSVDPSQNRSSMACSVSGDNFIVWGGYKWDPLGSTAVSGTPLIYNIHAGQWTTKFERGIHYKPTATPGPGSTPGPRNPPPAVEGSGDGGSKTNGAAVGGGVAGGLVIVLALTFLVVRRRRRRQQEIDSDKVIGIPTNLDQVLPFMERTSEGRVSAGFTQTTKDNQEPQFVPGSPQSLSAHPHEKISSWPPTPALLPPVIPPRPDSSLNPRIPQDHIQKLQHELAIHQEQLTNQNNPQYNPANSHTQPPSTLRGPQGAGDPITPTNSTTDHHDLACKSRSCKPNFKNSRHS
ncbi:MAG: hypothetical protein JOS17DRAFT_822898 [Linnemannia elongata]|nr:MAG: hypothetical protein JOS17DRAFT_822898 [Linnemannia elongata]